MRGPRVLVCGLGLTGQSLLRYLIAKGQLVSAWDSRAQPPGLDLVRAEHPALPIQCGDVDPQALLAACDWLAVSPGLPLDHPLLVAARARGLPILGDIAVFAEATSVPIVGVTGSNGKSTVVTALAQMARACGVRAPAGGNLGPPALDLLADPADVYLLELSSFQLDLCAQLPLAVGCILNISPDHLDRHGSLAAYRAAKGRVYQQAEVAVRNADDPLVTDLPGGTRSLSFGRAAAADYRLADGQIWHGSEPICATARLKLVGTHNQLNAAAALAIADALGWERAAAIRGLAEFQGLPHRCEWVATLDGVTWINDSKGTNVGALEAAAAGLDGPLIVLVGGQAKGGDFSPLAPMLARKAKRVVVYGEDAAKICAQLGAAVTWSRVQTLPQAVQLARDEAESGEVVLLSPGCASFDQYSGYEARGAHFRALVQAGGKP